MAFQKKSGAPAGAKKAEAAPDKPAPNPPATPRGNFGGKNDELPPSAFFVGTVTGFEPVNGTQGERIGNRVTVEISAYCPNGKDGADSNYLDALKGETKVVGFLSLPFSKKGDNRYIKISKLQTAREHAETTSAEDAE